MTTGSKIWFITGAAKGIGSTLAQALLDNGHKVAATSRSVTSFDQDIVANDGFLPLEVDLTSDASVKDAIRKTVDTFGGLDVVVNNAGYGQQGTVEALTDQEYRSNFEVNVFAPLNVLRHALPVMREQRSGHVVNIASIVGIQGGYAGWSSYAASKFAVAGLTESLAAEVEELGITATVVYPGPVRTDFLSSGSLTVAENAINDYAAAQASLDLHLNELDGKQPGDPEKVAQLIIDAVTSGAPPLHLFAGKIANQLAEQKIGELQRDLQAWRDASAATDFSEGA
ncbi:SDR family oxidoreductase [Paracoccus liaowanqingii]|uniref:SDR family oxidoreductase n=1 Tax=Paracoccus liaowanqingii TaxID=2560053 RepID=A0A4Z1BID7_9RHOB|nr:SDR family oxidoreductase [Paracoccus liaowanqingii]TGN51939.1 SDR family oxidoreductase [Paracoccus liaowanqingii]